MQNCLYKYYGLKVKEHLVTSTFNTVTVISQLTNTKCILNSIHAQKPHSFSMNRRKQKDNKLWDPVEDEKMFRLCSECTGKLNQSSTMCFIFQKSLGIGWRNNQKERHTEKAESSGLADRFHLALGMCVNVAHYHDPAVPHPSILPMPIDQQLLKEHWILGSTDLKGSLLCVSTWSTPFVHINSSAPTLHSPRCLL